MLISSILSPIIPGAGSGPSEPDTPVAEDENTGGVETGGSSTGGATESGSASTQGASGSQGASQGAPGAGTSASHGVSVKDSRQNAVSREGAVRRADETALSDIDLSRARAERTQKMLLQASLVDGMMRAGESDASIALFEREQPAGEPAERISARYEEF